MLQTGTSILIGSTVNIDVFSYCSELEWILWILCLIFNG
nr:MAG TPA: hypothetical protein [Caudoviricetes sp.]